MINRAKIYRRYAMTAMPIITRNIFATFTIGFRVGYIKQRGLMAPESRRESSMPYFITNAPGKIV